MSDRRTVSGWCSAWLRMSAPRSIPCRHHVDVAAPIAMLQLLPEVVVEVGRVEGIGRHANIEPLVPNELRHRGDQLHRPTAASGEVGCPSGSVTI